jgi:hypothetical protein
MNTNLYIELLEKELINSRRLVGDLQSNIKHLDQKLYRIEVAAEEEAYKKGVRKETIPWPESVMENEDGKK